MPTLLGDGDKSVNVISSIVKNMIDTVRKDGWTGDSEEAILGMKTVPNWIKHQCHKGPRLWPDCWKNAQFLQLEMKCIYLR